jgi:ABC-2 type transport system permease protein
MASPAFTTAGTVPPAMAEADIAARRRLGLAGYFACFKGIVWREVLRYLHQRERFLSALVRPLIWLFIFAAGFRQTLGVSIIPPYETYVLYEEFIAPGLIAMILLFNAMQSSLSMVYDRETGTMRTLLVSPFPRSFLLLSKLLGGVSVALLQAYAFMFVAWFWGIEPPPITQVKLFTFYDPPTWLGGALEKMADPIITPLFSIPALLQPFAGYITIIPAIILAGLMLGSLALFMSSVIRQLENFAGVMNFVIFPMFFASSALNPLWRMKEASLTLYYICQANPFTHAVELTRFALYGEFNAPSAAVVAASLLVFMALAIYGYDPARGLIARRAAVE